MAHLSISDRWGAVLARAVVMHAPTVSIITPAYNAARFLPETVASVFRQTFHDFELLIVDDGSTDGTLELARSWERTDPRVRVFTRANGGSSRARNTAMQSARGSYFALLDSDDLWQPSFLAAQLAVFEQYPEVGVVAGNAYNLGGAFNGRPLQPPGGDCRPLRLLDIIEHENSVCIMSVFRRAVADRIGNFDESLNHNEDYDYWIRAAQAGFAFVLNPRPLAYYRRRDESKSADEVGMIQGIIGVLQHAYDRCPDFPRERAAIERQIRRFNQERLYASAKASLRRRDFDTAAREFEALSNLRQDLSSELFALISRGAPQVLFWADQAKRALRTRRLPVNPVNRPSSV